MNILLVEDNALIRESAAQMMREMGHTVFEAGDARSGMTILREMSIDVLFADIGLPGGSGDVFAAEARALRPSIGVVFATGLADIPDPAVGDAGTVVLRKPYDANGIAAALAAARS
jgi:DNA-binding response OmpR family regulator